MHEHEKLEGDDSSRFLFYVHFDSEHYHSTPPAQPDKQLTDNHPPIPIGAKANKVNRQMQNLEQYRARHVLSTRTPSIVA